MTVIIDVIRDCEADSMPEATHLQRWAETALRALPDIAPADKPLSLSLRIVDAAESARLNLIYRHKDYATNVLSFGSELPEAIAAQLDELPLGDLVICAPVVAREAQEQNKSASAHWAHMLVHGILHLNGYDHIEDTEAETMEALEITILAQLGFDNPYLTSAIRLNPGE